MPERIYLDHHATTPCDPRVVQAMLPYFTERCGNPSSPHLFGWEAEEAVERAAEQVGAALGASAREVVFTSSATESVHLALFGLADGLERAHFVTTAIEHPAVLESLRALERRGHALTVVGVGPDGIVDPAAIEAALRPETALCSVMWANNEIGTVQPVHEIVARCHARGVVVHSDACQAVGRVEVDLHASGVDLLTLSGHKVHGPKGIGALLVRRQRPRLRLSPQLHGGGQQGGLRSGTLPVPLVVGLGEACRLAAEEREAEAGRLRKLRERLLSRLLAGASPVRLNGDPVRRLAGNLSVCLPGVEAEAILLELPGLGLSVGSACSASHREPSHVLRAIGLTDADAHATLRIGLGRGNTEAEVDLAAERIAAVVRRLRAESPVHDALREGSLPSAEPPSRRES